MGKKLKFEWDFEAEVWTIFDADVSLRFWRSCLIEILKIIFVQELCKNLWYLKQVTFVRALYQSPHPAHICCRLLEDFLFHLGNGSNSSNLRLKMGISTLGRLKNHKIPHYPHYTMSISQNRLRLKIHQFFVTFHNCSNYSL